MGRWYGSETDALSWGWLLDGAGTIIKIIDVLVLRLVWPIHGITRLLTLGIETLELDYLGLFILFLFHLRVLLRLRKV